jgi:hypothetical protein
LETFFDILETEINKNKSPSGRIFNVDEKGVTTVQFSNSKIIANNERQETGTGFIIC